MAATFNKKLLVEGSDDKHVIWALCTKFQLPETFEVVDCKGYTNLLDQLTTRLKEPDTETIGIVLDADTDLNSRWESLKHTLQTQGYDLPNTLPSEGLILKVRLPNIGIWIMPNNNLNGMLEDFLAFLVPQDDALMPCVKQHLDYIENQGAHQYNKSIHRTKAEIHTWLAAQETPGTPLGQSITKRYLSTDDDTCQLFVNWLNQLFND